LNFYKQQHYYWWQFIANIYNNTFLQFIRKIQAKHYYLLLFFFNSPFHCTGLSGTLRSACYFLSFFPLCAGGFRGTFPGHPRPPSLLLFPFWTTQHEIQHKHPWEAHPAWDLNPADLAVVSEECRSCFHHPTVSP
jgi:hypothetical protein